MQENWPILPAYVIDCGMGLATIPGTPRNGRSGCVALAVHSSPSGDAKKAESLEALAVFIDSEPWPTHVVFDPASPEDGEGWLTRAEVLAKCRPPQSHELN
jgi:hypothetical protein